MQSELPVIVVPCFNERDRLDTAQFESLAKSGHVRLLFVDDGSADRTLDVLHELATATGVDVLELPRNVGKAEAVRLGLLRAIDSGASITGYLDADLSTPPDELVRLLEVLAERPGTSFVMGARVALLGRTIERSALRHYLGRVFATLASGALRVRVYDTQCGAKVFRVTPELIAALDRSFRSSWVFDVELIGRLLHGTESVAALPRSAFVEVPLREWHHASGSKLTAAGMVRALVDLGAVAADLSLRRKRPARSHEAAD